MIIVLLILSFLLLFFYTNSLKKTIFGVNIRKGDYLGFFVFYNLIIYIIPSVLLLNSFPISSFWVAFKVKASSVLWISIMIIIVMFCFYWTLYFISKFKPKYYYINSIDGSFVNEHGRRFVKLSLVLCLFLISYAWLFNGVGHSFTLSFMDDVSISTLRSEIAENKSVKAIKHLFIFITPLLAAIAGSSLYNNRKIERNLVLLIILFIASWGGSKGPLINVLIIYFITRASFKRMKIKVKTLIQFFVFIFFIFYITYRVVLFQYPDLVDFSLFFNYFSQRVFVAQMIGVYEQFNLFIHDVRYTWHGIPFASSFVDYPIFHKDLMLVSEDRYDATTIGIKNTLFIAEAYGMGGLVLLVLSPFWIAISFALNYRCMLYIYNKYIFKNLEFSKRITAISIFSYVSITGGFSDLMFFKITIMMILLIMPFLIVNKFIAKVKM
ncbi:hypothetical protein [Flavobacterium beibuense]|uniref:hypothetical protein n=1 Tax=Flavobacterium beibuense TaxID=657326 RepID=UPI003A93EF59